MARQNVINNERWPHTCRIYRIEEENSFEDGIETLLYEGKCRFSGNTSLRTFYEHTQAGRVIIGEYRLGLPVLEGDFREGDVVDVVLKNGERKGVQVSDAYVGTLGTTIYCKISKN